VTTVKGSWSEPVAQWQAMGQYRKLHGYDVFTIDVPAVSEEAEPLLVLHGFPTSSFDFRPVWQRLARRRRVLFLDFVGFGFSAKPDIRYSIEMHADVTMAFMDDVGVSEFALLTHDMGDTVGGELLARQSEDRWLVDIVRRVLTNGSIYIEDAHLSDGQQVLLSLPDEALDLPAMVDGTALAAALTATFSPGSEVEESELVGACELIGHDDGHLLLPRLIRYIEDRRQNQSRYTGAIEGHPSPLAVVWGLDDPIAVASMTTRLQAARPDAELHLLAGVGHYPMMESPEAFATAIEASMG
jgi:pimeloyl-ACP methyl ester carboxylesterase